MEEQNKRKSIIYLTIGVLTLVSLVVGATYAYLQAQVKNGTNASVDITSGSTDHLVFATDGNITINASADNFKENGLDLSDTATASAILTANNTTHIANDTYNVYLDITNNNLEYSSYKKENDTKIYLKKEVKEEDITNGILDTYTPIPELYLKVDGPTTFNKKINGLNLDSEGYDITEKRGLITIAEDVPISTTAPEGMTTDTWTITITFKNLKTNQQLNTGKELKGKIIIQKEKLVLSKLLADANKEGEEPTLLYHDGQKDYAKEANYALEAEDYSYRYTGGNDVVNNYVCFGGDCSNEPTNDNYANLYRIIGLFDDDKDGVYNIKLIKADYATEDETGGEGIGARSNSYYDIDESIYQGKLTTVPKYYWNNDTNNNNWGESNLNTKNLNEFYLNYIKGKEPETEKWYNMIEDHTWTTAGNTEENIYYSQNAKNTYNNEIKNPAVGAALSTAVATYPARVGLMYISDYMYGASQKNWTTVASEYSSAVVNNWLYLGLNEWFITRNASLMGSTYIIDETGNSTHRYISDNYSGLTYYDYTIRPVMYLNSNVKITSGTGTSSNPYIISQ